MSRLSRFIHFYTDEDDGNGREEPFVLKTIKAALVHITDALAKPLLKCEVTLEPIQAGSGDPSPENVRPITGFTGANAVRTGKNLFDKDGAKIDGKYISATGEYVAQATACIYTVPIRVSAGTAYCISGTCSTASYIRVAEYKEDGSFIQRTLSSQSYSPKVSLTTGANTAFLRISPDNAVVKIQVETGSTRTDYEDSGTTIPITFPDAAGMVYSGTYDFVSGKLKSAPYYASYNGETLTGHWISDRDVYAEGTTPTIGAQVVNDGGTLTEYDLTPQQIQMLLGENNVWNDCNGDTEVSYKASAS